MMWSRGRESKEIVEQGSERERESRYWSVKKMRRQRKERGDEEKEEVGPS